RVPHGADPVRAAARLLRRNRDGELRAGEGEAQALCPARGARDVPLLERLDPVAEPGPFELSAHRGAAADGHQGSAEHHRFGPAQHYQHLPSPTENHKFRALKSERKRLPRHETRSGSASRWAWEGWPRPKTDVPAMISRSARAA